MNNDCECCKVNNGNRHGVHFKASEDNDFTEEEIRIAKKLWDKVGSGEMTTVYKCRICGQLWGASPAGHGWTSYRRLPANYKFN